MVKTILIVLSFSIGAIVWWNYLQIEMTSAAEEKVIENVNVIDDGMFTVHIRGIQISEINNEYW